MFIVSTKALGIGCNDKSFFLIGKVVGMNTRGFARSGTAKFYCIFTGASIINDTVYFQSKTPKQEKLKPRIAVVIERGQEPDSAICKMGDQKPIPVLRYFPGMRREKIIGGGKCGGEDQVQRNGGNCGANNNSFHGLCSFLLVKSDQ